MAWNLEMTMTKSAAILERFTGLSETGLVTAAQKGDLEAFNQIVLFYQSRIFNLAFRILGNKESAEDITQNTFIAAYLNLPRFRNGSFLSWLYRITTNACYDELRWHKRRPALSYEREDNSEERLLPLHDYLDPNISPEKEIERHELDKVIQQALDQLDADQRMVVVLVDLQGFDYQDAANTLGIPIGTVKSRLARARVRLHQLLNGADILRQEDY